MHEVLTLSRADGRCHARLERPAAGNALNATLVGALLELIESCMSDGTHTLVIEGAGKHFCTGFDLSDVASVSDDTLLGRFVRIERLLQAVADAPFATVAQVHGRAAGAGADLVAACQERCITPDTTLSFPGATGFGLVLGTRRLAERVGMEIALDWVSTGRLVAADEALATGLATSLRQEGSAGQTTAHRSVVGGAVVGGTIVGHAGFGDSVAGRPAVPRTSDALTALHPDAFTAALLAQATQGASDTDNSLTSHDPRDAAAHRQRMNDRDLALLVASAARPGLALRIADYIGRLATEKRAAASRT